MTFEWPWDHVYVLNLDHFPDKWKKIKKTLKKNGIINNVKRISAVYGLKECPFGKEILESNNKETKWKYVDKMNDELIKKNIIHKDVGSKYKRLRPGEIGHLLSFIKIFKDAIDKNYHRILLLEDDAIIKDDFKNKFIKAYKYMPNDWNLIYLGVHPFHIKMTGKQPKINKHICKLKGRFYSKKHPFKKGGIYGTHAMILDRYAIKQWLKKAVPLHLASDVIMGQLTTIHKLIKSYYICEDLVSQHNDIDKSTTVNF